MANRTFHFTNYEAADRFVGQQWPEALHEDVGYWRIPREARIFYNGNVAGTGICANPQCVAHIDYVEMMRRRMNG